jgi:lipoyl(octanoyl) transferase
MQEILFRDLDKMEYQQAWDYQEGLLQKNLLIKAELRKKEELLAIAGGVHGPGENSGEQRAGEYGMSSEGPATTHYLLFVEHPPVYTLGKSGHIENVLLGSEELEQRGVQFFRTNRGGDITFHGPGQIVGYPILDLEKFYTDIGKYLRNLEEVIIQLLAVYGIKGERSAGETGVWIEPGIKGRERKICAIGVRCSRWVTMHGFAFNVNTDLSYFGGIIPCGIQDKQVTSLEKELGHQVPFKEVKEELKRQFERVFEAKLVSGDQALLKTPLE